MLNEGRADTVAEVVRLGVRRAQLWKNERVYNSEWMPWFRGEPDSKCSTALRPKLFRPNMALTDRLHYEQELRVEFRRCAAQLINNRPSNPWEWYFLMQHYRVPTRLLDWSDGVLIALHFAICDRGGPRDRLGTQDAAVYTLDPWLLNQAAFAKHKSKIEGVALSDWRETNPYLPQEMKSEGLQPIVPLAIDPTHLISRVAAQRSHFTVFGRHIDALRKMRMENRNGKSDFLAKIRIDGSKINLMKCELRMCGISEQTIFPDMEGLGRGLNEWWQSQCEGDQ
jgi:hypothetical protein